MRSILLVFLFYATCYASENSRNSTSEKNGYAFYYPLTVSAKQTAQVCFAIEEHLLPAIVKITFVNRTCDETCEPHTVNTDFSCWQINIPDQHRNDYSLTTIVVEIDTNDKDVKFKEEKQIRIYPNDQQIILETDRSVYKMGDTVKIRLVLFDFHLKPVQGFKIFSLEIKSPYPSAATVKKWENITTNLGLVHLEFQLAPDTPEGYWSITGDNVYGSFEVKKYILPRFQTIINGPDRVYNGSKSISFSVCAKYSYGRNVKGVALLGAKSRYDFSNPSVDFNQVKDLKGGCAKFDVPTEELGLNKQRIWSIDWTASVTEDGTEQIESATKYTYIYNEPYSYQWNYQNRYIKPKLPYVGTFSLTDVEIPLNNSNIELCYKLHLDSDKTCSNFTLGSSNRIEFTVPPVHNASKESRVEISASLPSNPLNHVPTYSLDIWHSTSKEGIKIVDSKRNPAKCRSILTYTVLYNSGRFDEGEEVEFKYILTSRGEILSASTILTKVKKQPLNLEEYQNVIGKENYQSEESPIDRFDLNIQLHDQVYTTSKLLVYYDYETEVISDVIDIDVNKCSPNEVRAKWTEDSLYPGEEGTLNIKTDRGSLCSVTSIDKASTFLGSSSRIDIDGVINRFHRYFHDNTLNCIEPKNETKKEGTSTTEFPGEWRQYRYYSPLHDSYDAFKDSNVGIISNLQFISKECSVIPYYSIRPLSGQPAVAFESASLDRVAVSAVEGVGGGAGVATDNRGSAVRSFFPETWLWDLVPMEEGEAKFERKLPDSITDWQGNVVCMSSNKGFGISDKIEIKGFKPFFVDILLPYSIKRNKEILHLPIPVFNYLNHSLPVRVILESNDDVVLADGQDKNSFSICLEAEDSYTHNYRIKATKLGYVKITVSADTNPAYVENCAPESIIRRRDVVQKSLLVEPEGYASSLVKSALLCANDSAGVDNVSWDISLPDNVVPDTINGKVVINSDILGPMFQNLENILVVPTGCGEQTMATLTPNLYVLQYLKANNALTDKMKEKILKNLEIGYQRMLTYVHDDGSFSAFGKSDKEGSMFLTAFVLRTFRQMKKQTFIDDDVINKAIKWVIAHQLENGCFDPVHHVFHEMGLASGKNQTTALTSYVLISFLETNTKVDEAILSKAKKCILNDITNDKYTLAISSYALGLMNLTKETKERLDKLLELSSSENGLLWWKQSDKSISANVEVSSYALMSLLRQDPTANLGTASSIVRWLQSQMNPRGGFFSTVDTVVGLDSISRYATLVNKKEPNVKVSLTTKTDKRDVQITKRDRTKPEILPLTKYPNEVKAKIEGDGCVSLQAAVSYYLDKPAALDDLKLDIELKPVNQKFKCSLIELKPCVSYTGLGEINMAIVEVNMPSGYAPDQASLYALKTTDESGVKKFEQIRNQVVFYITKLGSDIVCLPFKIEENLIVENVANATVKLYDYYKPEVSLSKSFKLEDCEANISVPA